MNNNTKPCYDCGTKLTAPFSYVVPATMAQIREETGSGIIFQDFPPLCKPCWEKAPKPAPEATGG